MELHPDNGTEFFNAHLVRFWKESVVGVHLSRSRPYQKNDNRFVEQKNDTLVRQYFGDLRFERCEEIEAMNALYEQMWVYYNLFQPVMHLIGKTVVDDKVRRKWDQAQTPFERLKSTGKLSAERQQHLQTLYEQTNPCQLREEIHGQLAQLWEQAPHQPHRWPNQQKGEGRAENCEGSEGARGPAREQGAVPPRFPR